MYVEKYKKLSNYLIYAVFGIGLAISMLVFLDHFGNYNLVIIPLLMIGIFLSCYRTFICPTINVVVEASMQGTAYGMVNYK